MFIQVHLVVAIENIILLVFYTETDAWQFRLISPGGEVFGQHRLYFNPQAAEKAAREWIYNGY